MPSAGVLRICTEATHFTMKYFAYGDIPCDGGTKGLSREVDRDKSQEMILRVKTVNAQQVHLIGLVHSFVPEDELLILPRELVERSPRMITLHLELE